jgi:hypothetical protein
MKQTIRKSIENKQKEVEKLNRDIAELKKDLSKKADKTEWVYIKELGIEIQKAIHHKEKSYNELVEEFGKEYVEEHLPTYAQLQFLRNSKYCEELGLLGTWEFAKQEDKISKENNYVARFDAGSDGVGFNCYRYPYYSDASLGVRFVAHTKKLKKR